MTFDEFLSIAKAKYGVTLYRLRTTTQVDAVFLVRPAQAGSGKEVEDARISPRPKLQLDDRIPAETIARICRDLHMKPADFDLFIG